MSTVKSFSVGLGDMFYINHDSDNFTIIDCCLNDENKESIVSELTDVSKLKKIRRFISTHPDDDHILGLKYLEQTFGIENFYCVENNTLKEDTTPDFSKYCELHNSIEKRFYLSEGCTRYWMNQSNTERGSSGINILWPKLSNVNYINALEEAAKGNTPNNISPIISYKLENSAKFIWMGDLETEFMENISNDIILPKTDILFAPHHGRESGKIPNQLLQQLDPLIIVIGEAPSDNLNYYSGYNTITQNSAGHIEFVCKNHGVEIYVSNSSYSVNFLDTEIMNNNIYYLGTLQLL